MNSEPEFLDAKRRFAEYLETNGADDKVAQRIQKLLANHDTRLIVNLNELRDTNPELARNFMSMPMKYIPPSEEALRDYIRDYGPVEQRPSSKLTYHLGFSGSFGSHRVSPRTLSSHLLGKLVCVEGIVTKCSLVRPKILTSVHYCPKTRVHSFMEYRDATSLIGAATSSVYPTKDRDGNALETEYGLCVYKDHQVIHLQEAPEKAPPGQLPRSIEIILDEDLVDRVKPGDRIMISGIYRALAGRASGVVSGIFRTAVLANHVKHLTKDVSTLTLSDLDMNNILSVSRRDDCLELLARSIAPSIYGHNLVKKAIVLVLVGGVEKVLDNGAHIRGDINLLMCGDPSTAKSQLLRSVMNVAPLVVNTTGRGSSGVGLTAAVVADRETGERRLEAGAMVLADRGIVCIDEFDKMNEADRVAIHEVMEQQTVTIAKAGIHTSLNARCSVIAAANPIYGQYDLSIAPAKNIGLPDSLLSRFDLLFIVLDQKDPDIDRAIADHVVRMHRYRRNNADSELLQIEDDVDKQDDQETQVYQKLDRILHGASSAHGAANRAELLTIPFVQKYLQYCKTAVKPRISDEASEFIAKEYAEIRSREQNNSLPISARSLETMIRLSIAMAKIRLSREVTGTDAANAVKMLREALFSDAPDANAEVRKKRKTRRTSNSDEESDDSDDSDDMDSRATRSQTRQPASSVSRAPKPTVPENTSLKPSVSGNVFDFDSDVDDSTTIDVSSALPAESVSEPRQTKKRSHSQQQSTERVTSVPSTMEDSDGEISNSEPSNKKARSRISSTTSVSSSRLLLFRGKLVEWFRIHRNRSECDLIELVDAINHVVDETFLEDEVQAILSILESENKVMVREGKLYTV